MLRFRLVSQLHRNLVLGGGKTSAKDDQRSGKINPEKQRDDRAEGSVKGVKIRDVFCVKHEHPLEQIEPAGDHQRGQPDLRKTGAPARREFVKHQEPIKEDKWRQQRFEESEDVADEEEIEAEAPRVAPVKVFQLIQDR